MDPELCCLCTRRPATDVVDERYLVCALCVDVLAADEVPPHPTSSAWEFPLDSLFGGEAARPRRTA